MLERYIEQLGKDLKMTEGLAPTDKGTYSLKFEPDLHLSLQENNEKVIRMHAILAPLPEEQQDSYLELVMEANLLGRETGGSHLGLDQEGKQITLSRFVMPDASYHDFYNALEDFINYADAWKVDTLEYHGS